MSWMRPIALAGLFLSGAVAAQSALPTVTLHYQERPPYYQTRPDGGVQRFGGGLPAAGAGARAICPTGWRSRPVSVSCG